MVHHPLTDKGIVQFKADWEKARGDGRRQVSDPETLAAEELLATAP